MTDAFSICFADAQGRPTGKKKALPCMHLACHHLVTVSDPTVMPYGITVVTLCTHNAACANGGKHVTEHCIGQPAAMHQQLSMQCSLLFNKCQ